MGIDAKILNVENNVSYYKGYIINNTTERPEIIGIVKKPYRSFFKEGLNLLNNSLSSKKISEDDYKRNLETIEMLTSFITFY